MRQLFILLLPLFLFSCSNEIQEKVVTKTDTVIKTTTVHDTVFKEKLITKTDTAFMFVHDTIKPVTDTLTVSSNYAVAKAWFTWPKLNATIKDKDTTLNFRLDSARQVIKKLHKKNTNTKETKTKVVKEDKPYIPWYIYAIFGLMAGIILFLIGKLMFK